MQRAFVLLTAALLTVGLAACAPGTPDAAPTATGLSSEQAERLAVSRFRNFDAGVRSVTVEIPGTTSGTLEVTGWFDYAAVAGYASVTVDGDPAGLIWWSHDTIATRSGEVDAALPAPVDEWQSGPLDASSTPLANALALVAALGADRPENPQLLAQSDALFLRDDEVDGGKVEVFAGPSSDEAGADSTPLENRSHYWVDATGLLLRFDAPNGSADRMSVNFGDGAGTTIPTAVPGT